MSILRAESGRNSDDCELVELIGELVTRSAKFSELWARHNVRWHTTGIKHVRHHLVGEVVLSFEAMQLTGDPTQTLVTFTAEPGSPSQQAIAFLASWVGEQEHSTDEVRAVGDRQG